MSTDLQKYSTENQLHTIRRYAEQRGYTIVRVFEDSGRSGLRMDGRDGLKSLMLEVQSGAASFQAILVYDVSRWGRFQDADGLKRPITVSPRKADADSANCGIVCGQSRIEAFIQLGQTEIPAIVIEAEESDCLVMSLVENCARSRRL